MALPRLARQVLGSSLLAVTAGILLAKAAAPEPFREPYDSEKDRTARPLSPVEAAKGFQVPPGFKVDVFAAEPEVRNPIAMTWDGRGRLWIAENFTYAERPTKFDLNLHDRVLIFTDSDGDGRPDKRTVFLDNVQRLTSLEVGRGGVWLMCPPQLLFVPDRNGDDIADGPAEVVLEGFTTPPENHHNLANGLRWGPDGWLYGRCGASAPGLVRRPDQGLDAAVPLAGTMWRYHPKTKVFEPLCHGTTNPWGHDWNEHGEGFFINTVNGHLWHLIPGAHFRRPHTISPNPFVYEPMEMHADHWHWDTGKDWSDSRKVTGEHDRRGGGHAHSGAMIYLADQWPESFRGKLLTLNFHGRRANVEKLERAGSGYVARHEPDALFAADPFFRGIELGSGPDGSVFILDWSDTGECHEGTGVHRQSGRVFRVRNGNPAKQSAPNLPALSGAELVALHRHANEWYARQARFELVNRMAAGKTDGAVREALRDVLKKSDNVVFRLRALWTLYSLEAIDVSQLEALLDDKNEHVRTWAVRLLTDSWPLDTAAGAVRAGDVTVPDALFARLVRLAREDESGLVRLALASTLQRLPVAKRPALAAALVGRAEDAADPNVPLLIWYGLIPVAQAEPLTLVPIAAEGRLPRVTTAIARRFTEMLAKNPAPLNELLARAASKPEPERKQLIDGIRMGLAGIRKAEPPKAWKTFSKTFTGTDAPLYQQAVQGIEVVFGDGLALKEVRRLALDGQSDLNLRKTALRTLIEARPPELREVCEKLLKVRFLNAIAVQGLTQFDDPEVAKLLAASYKSFHASERPAVIEAMASRPTFAAALLELIADGTVPRKDLTPFQVRQIRGFDKAALTKRLTDVWGELRDSPKDKADLVAKLKTELTPARLKTASKSQGRALFATACASCHRLFGAGAEIGPDLTGAGRKDIDYLLSNVVDPSAVVNKDFQMTVLNLADGRAVNGIVVAETDKTLTVQTAKERIAIPKEDVEKRTQSTQSLMPDALLQPFNADQIRDLIAYLMTDSQVELPAEKK